MDWIIGLLIFFVVWLIGGAFNVAVLVKRDGYASVEEKRWMMLLGPILAILLLFWFIIRWPVQMSAQVGTRIGERLHY